MTKNEIVASEDVNQPLISEDQFRTIQIFLFGQVHHSYKGGKVCAEYRDLHQAWVKFRDLKFDHVKDFGKYAIHDGGCKLIASKITHGTITEAFDELVKGIEWYQSLNQKP